MKKEDFHQFFECLMKAIQNIDTHYFQLPVANENELELIYRERVYCYELYHQLRIQLGDSFQYKLHGEVDKAGHTIIRKNKKPDFIVHKPGQMSNLVIMEVKPITVNDNIENLRNDFIKLKLFMSEAKYYRAIMLIYGNENGDLPHKIKQKIENIHDERIIILWHYSPNKKPKIMIKSIN